MGVAEAIGKTLVGALVPEDAGNILQVAVNRLLGDEKKQATSIFAGQNTSTALPLGLPTVKSPKVTPELTLEVWLAQYASASTRRNVRRVKPVFDRGLHFHFDLNGSNFVGAILYYPNRLIIA